MKVAINFNGVIEHLSILDEESSKSTLLKEQMESIIWKIPDDNYELKLQLKSIMTSVEALQRNVRNRKALLLQIVDDLRRVSGKNESWLADIEHVVSGLSDGECHE